MKSYNSLRLVTSIVLMSFMFVIAACATKPAVEEESIITFEQLIENPEKYSSVEIEIEGYFYQGFETIVISEQAILYPKVL
jgi:hypothetical protein